MIELYNPNRYLEPNIIEPCFIDGKTLSTNKQLTGNGFSTAFFKIKPSHGKVNILIAPNKAFIQDKELKYKENPSQYGHNRLKFFYNETQESDFTNADVLVFVADSFWHRRDSLSSIAHRVEKVLIDEIHSTEQQSFAFRKVLEEFVKKVETVFNYPFTAIAMVTATPMLFSKVDIVIHNEHIQEQTVHRSRNQYEAIKRADADIKNGENVVIFANNATVIYHLRNYKNILKARFIIGTSLMRTVVTLATITNDDKSNVTIASSRGFEGFDLDYEDAKVYFFEDRSRKNERFYISNLYQAINRTRKGAKYIEYCRQELSNDSKGAFSINEIDEKINDFVSSDFKYKSKLQSIENKQKRIFKDYHPFVIFKQDKKGAYSVKPNQVTINLYKESKIYDKPFPAQEFDDFIKERKLIFKDIPDVNNRLTKKVKRSQKIKNLYNNRELIKKEGLFDDDFRIKVVNLHSYTIKDVYKYRELYLKHLEEYLMRKNYDNNYEITERQQIALNILKDEKRFKKLFDDLMKLRAIRKSKKNEIQDIDDPDADYGGYRRLFADYVSVLIMFCNNRIKVPSKWIANRNYNLPTRIGMEELNSVGDIFNVSILELDIPSCYSRIIYALNNKIPPKNLYGRNKENKLKINVFLNNFFLRKFMKTDKRQQKNKVVERFRDFGFDDDVITYLVDNYFECEFRGDLFAKASFHECKIITDVKDNHIKDFKNDGVMRRHDSVLVFNNKADLSYLNEYEYLGVKGWFNVKTIPVYTLERVDDLDAQTVNF